MELAGEVVMRAARERVWSALNDAAVLRACIPGCEEVVDVSPTERSARLMVKLGPVRARFNGKMTLSEVTAPERCVIAFEGSGGAAGMASGLTQVALHEEGESTRLTYTVKAAIGGKLGQIGGRMIDASAKQLAGQFFAALGEHLSPRQVAAEGAAEHASAAPALDAPDARQAKSPPSAVVGPRLISTELSRLTWFLAGAASTGFGVWIGARLF